MQNAWPHVLRYNTIEETSISVSIINPAQGLYEMPEIARYFNINLKELRKKLKEYGAEYKFAGGFKKRYYFPDAETAQKFIDEYMSSLVLIDQMKRAQNE